MDLDSALRDMEAGDHGNILPAVEPFPEMAAPAAGQHGFLKSISVQVEDEELSESAEAPLNRRPRGPRVLPMDATQELRGSHLTDWNNNYVQNMAAASHQKLLHKLPYQAKKNAAAWVFGSGIGGVGLGLGSSKLPSPLDMFAGDKLMEALTGVELSVARKKRGRSEEEDRESESEGRRTRLRSDEGEQVGRGNGLMLDDNGLPPLFEDTVSSVELYVQPISSPLIEHRGRPGSCPFAGGPFITDALEHQRIRSRLPSWLYCPRSWIYQQLGRVSHERRWSKLPTASAHYNTRFLRPSC